MNSNENGQATLEPRPTSPPITADLDQAVKPARQAEPSGLTSVVKTTPAQIVLVVLGAIAFLYFARPVVLPVVLACIAGTTLKPLIRCLSCCHIPPTLTAAAELCLLVAAIGIGFFQLGRP